LADVGVESTVFSVPGEPRVDTARAGATLARDKACDWVVGIGGGAALDAAKAVATMLANEGDILDYLEIIGAGKVLTHKPLPFVLIPTTAGSGAEVTRNAVITSPENRVKVSLRSSSMLATAVIVDPELTYDLPPQVTAHSGMDALIQLLEAYVTPQANVFTDGLCVEGLRLAATALPRAFVDGRDVGARADMSAAALFGGIVLANAGLGAIHGIAGPLGGMIDAPHGAICSALAAQVVAINVRALRQRDSDNPALGRYREAAVFLSGGLEDCGTGLRRLARELKIPRLGELGLDRADIPELVEKSLRANSMKGNPILLAAEELREIIEASL
jgi:alcohol dehydrogenase class IV